MDERFGDWLREALADMDDDLLKRRWSGIESLSEQLEDREILELLLYCANCKTSDFDTIDKVRRIFWEHDNAFRMGNNDLELQRLCGSAVIHILRGDSQNKLNLALAGVCLYFGGLHSDFGLPAMAEEAETFLQELSIDLRSSFPAEHVAQRVVSSSKITTTFKQRIEEGHSHLPIADEQDMLAQHGRGLNQLAGDNAKLRLGLSMQREETDILWWLMGGFSNDLEMPFDSVGSDVASIIAGKELADHVSHHPGPLSAGRILQRVILGSGDQVAEASLKEVVARTPMKWRRQLAEQSDGEALRFCPILGAMVQSAAVDDDPSWIKLLANFVPHSTELPVPPAVLGYQMYRERMLSLSLAAEE